MASSCTVLVICAMAILVMGSLSAVDAGGDHDHHLGWMPAISSGGAGGSLLVDEEEEFQLDSDINRRILATSKYISYGALQRDTIPCSRRGASYYNCQRGAQANPYNRGCSAITRCRS